MSFPLPRGSVPLQVAAVAFFVGGLGNVAFSLHSGSQVSLAAVRFAVGLGFALVLVAVQGVRVSSTDSTVSPGVVSRPLLWLFAAAGCEALGIAFLMAAADHASTAVFTLIGLCAPALVALLAYFLPLPRPTLLAGAVAFAALLCAGGAVWAANGSVLQVSWLGLLLAFVSMVFGSCSAVAGSVAVRTYRPAVLLGLTCGFGFLVALVWWGLGAPWVLSTSTVAAAVFIALVPGGFAKLAWLWANARTAPSLVQSMLVVAVVSATLGGWVFLSEVPTVWQVVFSLLAVGCVSVLAFLRSPTRPVPIVTSG